MPATHCAVCLWESPTTAPTTAPTSPPTAPPAAIVSRHVVFTKTSPQRLANELLISRRQIEGFCIILSLCNEIRRGLSTSPHRSLGFFRSSLRFDADAFFVQRQAKRPPPNHIQTAGATLLGMVRAGAATG